ncbi:MAG: hypothetical protein ABI723_25875 [Bacteroidia bacterium]
MKLNKHILILLSVMSVITLFVSCNKANYYKITEEEENSWGIYQLNQSFRFISTQGDLLTYSVGGRFKAYQRNGNTYNEYLYTTLYLQSDSDYSYPDGYRGVFIDKNADGLSVKVGLPHFYDNVRINDKAPTMQIINGHPYTDVYVVGANPFYLDSINYIDTIYYSKAYGFLQYVDMYGETYTRTQ